MKRRRLWKVLGLTSVLLALPLQAVEGMTDVKSDSSVASTTERLQNILEEQGMTVFNRISHSDGAKKAGLELRETELLIFGNPKAGTPLMQCQQSVAIDLPQKALIWQDEAEQVWISYNEPQYLAKRHKVTGCSEALAKVEQALAKVVKQAAIP